MSSDQSPIDGDTKANIGARRRDLGASDSIWFALAPLLRDPVAPMQTLLRLAEKTDAAIPISFADRRLIFVSNVEHIKEVLVTKADNYAKYFDGLEPVFGKSMITIDGALWQRIRTPQQAAFHPSKLGEYLPFLLASLRDKSKRWDALAESGETVEMVEETWTLAADMVCKALFDREMPFNPHAVFGYVKTYTSVQNHSAIRQARKQGETDADADVEAREAMAAWGNTPDAVIAANSIDGRAETLLTMLTDAQADPAFPEFDHAQVVDEMKQYLWAGTETTALTLAWCLYLLSQNPDVAEKVRAEAEAVCGDGEPNWEQAQSLVYTKRVIQETMRLYPPVWSFIREAAVDGDLGGTPVKAGDTIVLFSYGNHHSPKYWTDPERFDPDRFAPDRAKARAKYSYLPFAAGRRACIGGALSQLENSLALAMLLRRYEPEYMGEVPAPIAPTVTLTPKGLPFRIRRR